MLLVVAPVAATAQIVYDIDFSTYTNGNLAGQGEFEQFGTNATNPIQVLNGAVVIPAGATADGQDVVLPFANLILAPISGFTEIWVDMLLNLPSGASGANPSYSFAMNTNNTLSSADGNFANARVAFRATGQSSQFGVRVTGQSGYPYAYESGGAFGERWYRVAVVMNPGVTNDVINAIWQWNTASFDAPTLNQQVDGRFHLTSTSTYSAAGGSATDPVSYGGFLISQFANATTQQTALSIKRLRIYLANVGSTSVDRGPETVGRMELEQNYPNPFNPSTQIRFTLQSSDVTRLAVYDVIGREVAVLVDGMMSAGQHQATFNADGLPSGMYLVRLEAGGQVMTRKMSLVK